MTFRRNNEFLAAIRKEAARRVERGTEIVRDGAKAKMDREGTGRTYTWLPRQASAPGEPPVTQLGGLAASLRTYPVRHSDTEVAGATGSDVEVLWRLEAGDIQTEPRPLLMPSLLESKPEIMAVMGGRDE